MITAIEIENFKGIRDRVRVELKPITLLFGANSSGKSSILHALHYVREVFERHNLDAETTLVGGRFIDLGGFHNLVHGHDLTRPVILRFELDVAGWDLPPFVETFDRITEFYGLPIENLFVRIRSAAVTVELIHSELLKRAYVRRYAIDLDGLPFAEITHYPERRTTAFTKLETEHPSLFRRRDSAGVDATPEEIESIKENFGDIDRSVLGSCLDDISDMLNLGGSNELPLMGLADAMPLFDRSLRLARQKKEPNERVTSTVDREALFDELMVGISQMVVGPGQLLLEALQSARYLGPLRETPPRNFTPARFYEPSRWANGFAAWDLLYTEPKLAEQVNAWLTGPDSLELGYTIKVKSHKQLPIGGPLLVLLLSDRVFEDLDDVKKMVDELPTRTTVTLVAENGNIEMAPHDVGVGISQLIPVVVLAVSSDGILATIEQPELHVHPAVQVRLGDLFIHEIAADPVRRFLLETHSEHLLLRLLRRIRETKEGELPPGHPELRPEQVSVIYVEAASSQFEMEQPLRVRSLRIDESGEFLDQWPRGFFEERGEELFGP